MAEVDGLVNPGCSRYAPPVYHTASRAATRAWLKDYFDPKHDRTEKIPNPSSDREEWHLPAWANKAKVNRTHMDDNSYLPSDVKRVSLSVFKRIWIKYFPHIKTPAHDRFTKCGICVACTEPIRTSDCPVTVSIAKKKRHKHWERVTTERLYAEAAILESRRRPDMLFCDIDGMDSSKTLLPHSAIWSKDVVKDKLQKVHLTCVKYNGMRPDDVYSFTDIFPHDSSCTITVMWLTIMKDMERRGSGAGSKPLRKGKVLSISQAYQFSVRKPEKPIDHAVQAEIFMSQRSDTDIHGPEHFMKYMPEGKPFYLPGRPSFHSHKDGRGKTVPLSEVEAEKRFDDMESHILFLAAKFDFCAHDIEEWVHTLRELREKQWEESRPFDKFWPEDTGELQHWLRNRPPCPARGDAAGTGTAAQPEAGPAAHNARNAAELPHDAEAAVGRMIEVMEGLRRLEWNPVTTIRPGKTNDDSIKQFFDAGQGNLVIMDMSEHHENITEAERLDLLGDWEATRSVGKIRSHKD
eukprot:jgi/Tetstr1/448808/TSEL_036042.t1